jgi:hypothetical protein
MPRFGSWSVLRDGAFVRASLVAEQDGKVVAALIVVETGRNAIGVEIDSVYVTMAKRKLAGCCSVRRMFGPLESELLVDYSSQAQLRRVSDPSLSGQQPAAVLV